MVLVGLGNLGYRVFSELARKGVRANVVEVDAAAPFLSAVLPRAWVVPGDARLPGTLQEAGVEGATVLLALTGSDVANLGCALAGQSLRPGLRTVVRVFSPAFAQKVVKGFQFDAGVSASALAAPVLVAAALAEGTVWAYDWGDALLSVRRGASGLEATLQELSRRPDA